MQADQAIRTARRRAGLSLRALAARSGTSHSTLAAYEHGRKVPRADTLVRILEAAGFDIALQLVSRPGAGTRAAKGRELAQALELAAQFPARHERTMPYPRFGRAA